MTSSGASRPHASNRPNAFFTLRKVAGVCAPVAFVTSWVVAGALRAGYDPVHHSISRLAALGVPNRWIVTSGMIVFGVGVIVFAPLASPHSTRALLVVAAVASFGVAFFPCTPGCPGPGAVSDTGHAVAAAVQYVAFVLAAFLHGRLGKTLAVVAGLFLMLHGVGTGPNGLMQRAGLTTLDAWLIFVAMRTRVAGGRNEGGRDVGP